MSETIKTLDELLNDPMIQLVMERDRVKPAELRMHIERARGKVTDAPAVPPPHIVAKSCVGQWLRG